jgi:hypothetical protein
VGPGGHAGDGHHAAGDVMATPRRLGRRRSSCGTVCVDGPHDFEVGEVCRGCPAAAARPRPDQTEGNQGVPGS